MTDDRLARLRRAATRPRRTVPVLLDGEVREQIGAVEDELDRLDSSADTDGRLSRKPAAVARREELEAELASLREQAADQTLYLVLEGLQRTAFRTLAAQHPPRKEDGKVIPMDRLFNANLESIALPLARACVIGHRERPDADAPVLPVDREILVWLLGDETTEPFATERQVDQISGAALTLCVGDDAVPLPRRRSPTGESDSG